jgi:hypothetical protein
MATLAGAVFYNKKASRQWVGGLRVNSMAAIVTDRRKIAIFAVFLFQAALRLPENI